MTMNIRLAFRPDRVTNAHPGPPPGFTVIGALANPGETPVAVYGALVEARLANRLQLPTTPVRDAAMMLEPGQGKDIWIVLSLSRDTLADVERKRDSSSPQLELGLNLRVAVAPVVRLGNGPGVLVGGPPTDAYAEVRSSQGRDCLAIPREEWLGLLRGMGFSETEVFEIPALRLVEKDVAREPVQFLRQAETAFRQGDWDGTLAKCRLAMEAVAKLTGQTDKIKEGFAALWEKRALAHQKHEAKRKPLDDLACALGDFQHLGRHVKFPYHPIDRDDALLGLRMTMALFEYVGRRCEA